MLRSLDAACCLFVAIALGGGCAASRPKPEPLVGPQSEKTVPASEKVRLVSHQEPQPEVPQSPEALPPPAGNAAVVRYELKDLEGTAIANNPALRRMQAEAAAARAKVGYVSKLPDPTVSSVFFVPPMNFDPDRQVADLQVMQMIPWLARLNAEAKKAHLEALAAENDYLAERLRIVAEVRVNWFKLYVLARQIETTQADQAQLTSLIHTANSRVGTGDAQPGDVLMATLELSNQQEQLISYRQQMTSTIAELNRLVGRSAQSPIWPPRMIDAALPDWRHEMLLGVAMSSQPELNAARLRTAASRWGIGVARLKRRPDVTLSGGWIVMDAPGAAEPDAGADSWTVGISATVPIWHSKYKAMIAEASHEHFAAFASEEEVALRLDATLRDLWEQALAAQRTVDLYEKSILPQARQTFEANQKSLVNNTVSFDRVIRDYRTLLNLELGYHRARGQLATALARIRQAVGSELTEEVWTRGPQQRK